MCNDYAITLGLPCFFFILVVSSISRVLRARFGKKDDEEDCDKKDEDGEKKTKHSIDGILGDKGRLIQLDLHSRFKTGSYRPIHNILCAQYVAIFCSALFVCFVHALLHTFVIFSWC